MVDVRRALPASPAAVCCGLAAMHEGWRGTSRPEALVVVGTGVAVLASVALYRAMESWQERSRRMLGYVTALLIGVVTAAAFLLAALAASFCSLWGETCTASERAAVGRYVGSALVALVAMPLVYAVLDLATRRRV
jgi:hypothetical protein